MFNLKNNCSTGSYGCSEGYLNRCIAHSLLMQKRQELDWVGDSMSAERAPSLNKSVSAPSTATRHRTLLSVRDRHVEAILPADNLSAVASYESQPDL